MLAFLKLLEELDLIKAFTKSPTFHHHNGTSESNIDYFLVSKEYYEKLSDPVATCTLDNPENLSAHDPVTAVLRIPDTKTNANETDYSDTYTNFNRLKVIWDTTHLEKYQHTAAMALTEYDNLFPLPEHIPLKCELFSNLLVRSAEICMETKLVSKEPKKHRKPSPRLN